MKEATGELNMTVITVVAIAGVAALLYAFVWPMVQANIINSTKCANVISCDMATCSGGICDCTYLELEGDDATPTPIKCPDQASQNGGAGGGTTE